MDTVFIGHCVYRTVDDGRTSSEDKRAPCSRTLVGEAARATPRHETDATPALITGCDRWAAPL